MSLLLFVFPILHWKVISRLNKILITALRQILGIKVIIEGKEHASGRKNFLIISNHLTYIDGIVMGSLFPVLFVSKKEVKSWPLFGVMVSLAATIFIDRERRNETPVYVEKISNILKNKINVMIFPEGTSTDGTRLLSFQTAFFSSPIISKTPVLPIAIRYLQIDNQKISEANKDMVYWYGKMPFFTHLWEVLKLRKIVVKVKINPAIDSTKFKKDGSRRKELSTICHDVINKAIKNIKS
ncbi:MAG: lysophospholipid acyltransferase family protein [Candidatus Omnitrophota bacterium]